jgi:hypothetical protein
MDASRSSIPLGRQKSHKKPLVATGVQQQVPVDGPRRLEDLGEHPVQAVGDLRPADPPDRVAKLLLGQGRQREPSLKDRRRVHVYLTPRAKALEATLLPYIREVNALATI